MVNSEHIDTLLNGYRASQIILTAHRLGLFKALGADTKDSDSLAEFLETDKRATRMLCDALVSLEVLEKDGDSYCNTSHAADVLDPKSPKNRCAIFTHYATLYEKWGKLFDAVKTGTPVSDEALDPRLLVGKEGFADAMADVARMSAAQTLRKIDLSSASRMLDVGGGPGIFSIEFAKAHKELHAVIVDDEDTLEVAKRNIGNAGLNDRVSTLAGNIFQLNLTGEFDFIFLSNVVHIFSYERNSSLISQLASLLGPGGRICVKDFILDPDRTSPEWSALFAINMLVHTDEGDCYTVDEVRQWFEAAGLRAGELISLNEKARILIGEKA